MYSTDSLQINWNLVGFIREENKKVYFLNTISFPNDTTDHLFFDFNAQTGDSIYSWGGCSCIVDSTDNVLILNKFRKRYYLYCMFPEVWIEGIGSMNGFTQYGICKAYGRNIQLLCFKENDTIKYNNPNFNFCYFSTTGMLDVQLSKNLPILFPNPVIDISTLKLNNQYINAEIYNNLGLKMKDQKVNGMQQLQIKFNDFIQGNYIIRLTKENGDFNIVKFIVQ